MAQPVIIDAIRTPIGKRGGALAGLHPAELLGSTLVGLMKRANIEAEQVDQVVGGCVTQAAKQGSNVTRIAWLSQALPYETAATKVDCQCRSSQQANHFIANNAIDFDFACGVESMSHVPLGSDAINGLGKSHPANLRWDMPHQFGAAGLIAKKHDITRAQVDAFALASQQGAARAWDEGRFERGLFSLEAPVIGPEGPTGEVQVVARDEGPRVPLPTSSPASSQ